MAKPTAEEIPEEQRFLEILRSSFYNLGKRTKLDRYQEFRNIFLGSDEGKRVLSEILGIAKLSARLVPPYPGEIDTKRLLVNEGRRELAADIIDVIYKEPNMEKPTQQKRRPRV